MTRELDEDEAAATEAAMDMLRSRLKWGTKHWGDGPEAEEKHQRSTSASIEMRLRFLHGRATDEDREAVGEVLARVLKDVSR